MQFLCQSSHTDGFSWVLDDESKDPDLQGAQAGTGSLLPAKRAGNLTDALQQACKVGVQRIVTLDFAGHAGKVLRIKGPGS